MEKNTLIEGYPCSGKTTELIKKAMELLKKGENVLFLVFNKEHREKIKKIFEKDKAYNWYTAYKKRDNNFLKLELPRDIKTIHQFLHAFSTANCLEKLWTWIFIRNLFPFYCRCDFKLHLFPLFILKVFYQNYI